MQSWLPLRAQFNGLTMIDTILTVVYILVAVAMVVLILLQLAQVVVLLALPVLSLPIGLASVFAFFYLLTHFTAALNGFTSLIKTFFAILYSTL